MDTQRDNREVLLDTSGSRIRVSRFEFFPMVLGGDAAFGKHRHSRPHLIMVFRGGWRDLGGSSPVELGAGDVLFHPAEFVHSSRVTAPDTEVIVMRVAMEVVDAFCPLYGNVARDVRVPFENLRGVPDRIREELLRRDEAAPFVLESLAMELLALGSRAQGFVNADPPLWFPAAMTYIQQSFTTRITARTIAERAGISASRVSHVFREIMGRSIADYVRQLRVRAAAKALRESDDTISAIACAAGFYDQAQLARAFKQVRNMTPGEYRRSHR